ncbi:hypothetical protein BU23DRAFT_645640 [Bimuria novae-zelandiae CBS 107.79]|uniref:Uncharacterized protein n=1 Tax=Bimuria novae-zelandiae CBS 107.79 TaxID=1447943 RepID=A0A6A5V3T9_9PLEO|nr:hypothetical protein BU23DRAFT_645640 [Bimuria novae-zelandiae CBS 107.79]
MASLLTIPQETKDLIFANLDTQRKSALAQTNKTPYASVIPSLYSTIELVGKFEYEEKLPIHERPIKDCAHPAMSALIRTFQETDYAKHVKSIRLIRCSAPFEDLERLLAHTSKFTTLACEMNIPFSRHWVDLVPLKRGLLSGRHAIKDLSIGHKILYDHQHENVFPWTQARLHECLYSAIRSSTMPFKTD